MTIQFQPGASQYGHNELYAQPDAESSTKVKTPSAQPTVTGAYSPLQKKIVTPMATPQVQQATMALATTPPAATADPALMAYLPQTTAGGPSVSQMLAPDAPPGTQDTFLNPTFPNFPNPIDSGGVVYRTPEAQPEPLPPGYDTSVHPTSGYEGTSAADSNLPDLYKELLSEMAGRGVPTVNEIATIDAAIAAGIPLDYIQYFLRANPGDYGRIVQQYDPNSPRYW